MSETIDYYDANADSFAEGTLEVEFSEVQDKFLMLVPDGGVILDFGCGSGRDTRYFLDKGYQVEAIDGSEKLCEIASRNTGIRVKHIMFAEFDETEKYDGIWACASILHLTKYDLKDVFARMIRAVKRGRYIYTSFKYGKYEGIRNGRFFTDFTEDTFDRFIYDFADVFITDRWVSEDVRPGRGDEKWLNIILQKSDTV